jgi:hypothetical protein
MPIFTVGSGPWLADSGTPTFTTTTYLPSFLTQTAATTTAPLSTVMIRQTGTAQSTVWRWLPYWGGNDNFSATAALAEQQRRALYREQQLMLDNANMLARAYQTRPAAPELTTPAIVDRQKRRAKAMKRARRLLLAFLTPEQRKDFLENGGFNVTGRSGQVYRLNYGHSANIDAPHLGGRLCVHPVNIAELPVEDTLISQLLHLKEDDDALIRIANLHPGIGLRRAAPPPLVLH